MNAPAQRTGTIRLQPLPILTKMGSLNGVTAIQRYWDDGDEARCRLCSECTAFRGSCTVLTEEAVTEGGAPLYSSLGLDFGDGDLTGRSLPPFGRGAAEG